MADVVFTSPPYGFSNSARIRKNVSSGHSGHEIDSLYDEYNDDPAEWLDLMRGFMDCARAVSKTQFINVQMLSGNKKNLVLFLNEYINGFVDVMIWNKVNGIPNIKPNVLNSTFEFVLIFDNENNSKSIRFGDFKGNVNNLFNITRERNEYADIHKAVFPLSLPNHILSINSKAKTVFEPFGGTGTTLISCETLGKQCFCMELSEQYVDTIIDRWEHFTGRKAELIS